MCPTLSHPENGRVSLTTCSVPCLATYSCNNGYNLTGATERVCAPVGTTGQWRLEEPTCPRKLIVITCTMVTL